MTKTIDISGQRFGRLTVIKNVPKPEHSKLETSFWLCRCDCGKEKIVSKVALKNGNTKSCGCLGFEVRQNRILEINQQKKKYNNFEVCGNKTIVFLKDGTSFTIDTTDKDFILNFYWAEQDGYITTQIKTDECKKGRRKLRKVHQLLIPDVPTGFEVDHIDRNKRNNTRKNLRIVTHQENMQNTGLPSTNKTGCKNISFDKNSGKYLVVFRFKNKKYYVGRFEKIEDAKIALDIKKNEIKKGETKWNKNYQ